MKTKTLAQLAVSKYTTEEEGVRLDEALNSAHAAEAQRHKVEIFNFGYGCTDTGICSKTSFGFLSTERTAVNGRVRYTHTWE